jgi:hypothetical protein
MTRKKKESKLKFIPLNHELKELSLNTIPQVSTTLSYVLKWAKLKTVIESHPDDHDNVVKFFKAINKLSPQKYQSKKFKALWTKHNMKDITDYDLEILGDVEVEEEDQWN